MDNVLSTILQKNLIEKGDIVAVACSGGSDSMALLHKLNSIKNDLGFAVIAVTIDHSIRQNGSLDVKFVEDYCKKNNIRCYTFKIDVPRLAKQKQLSLESAGRQARYGVFDALISKKVATKIALAHHIQDQAETILLHLFRGAGLSGVRGMDYKKDEYYIRPLLNTSKNAILEYLTNNDIPYVTDETNAESEYTRNYLRNEIFPLLIKKWPNITTQLINFSKSVIEDDDYINKNLNDGAVIIDDKVAKIPLSYFLFDNALINRIIFRALNGIGINVDIERKHIDAIKELAKKENGKKINLPLGVTAYKEYDYLTLNCKNSIKKDFVVDFKCGSFVVPEFGKISIKRVNDYSPKPNVLYLDAKKLPKGAIWRYRSEGDFIEKFGGGTKKLKSYLIDKKIPKRERDLIPVLAFGKEIYAIAGVDISNKVKIDDFAKSAIKIEIDKK